MKNTLHLRSLAQLKISLQGIIDKSRIVAVAGRAIASQFSYSIYHKCDRHRFHSSPDRPS
ncbi:hypothetical protein QUB63_17470 [Microcoleus sp. ARI1-B5]|uniref:hypothetical protein n=1 Tax=unclassified Microcoleus TaxID=2642155 RepID=UPI002FCE8A95